MEVSPIIKEINAASVPSIEEEAIQVTISTAPTHAGKRETDPAPHIPLAHSPPEPIAIESPPTKSSHLDGATSKAATAPTLKDGSVLEAPLVLRGWLTKQGHKVRNWKTRYFVLDRGLLSYYADQKDTAPFGDNLKGQICLAGYLLLQSASSEVELPEHGRSVSVVGKLSRQFSNKAAESKQGAMPNRFLLQQGPNKALVAYAKVFLPTTLMC